MNSKIINSSIEKTSSMLDRLKEKAMMKMIDRLIDRRVARDIQIKSTAAYRCALNINETTKQLRKAF